MSKYHLSIQDFSLSNKNNLLLESQDITIYSGQRIGIIGRNGIGKSSLLKELYNAAINIFKYNAVYIPQVLERDDCLSGGERLINHIYSGIIKAPALFFLDEPTNHLDECNRNMLFHELLQFTGTLIFISHDVELLNLCCNEIWHIDNKRINKYQGNYNDYQRESNLIKAQKEISHKLLKKNKQENHISLMYEQKRASSAKRKGIKNITSNKYATIKSLAKADRANQTTSNKKKKLKESKNNIINKIDSLYTPKQILPVFNFSWRKSYGAIINISSGSISYDKIILSDIELVINSTDKVWLQGNNGSGKSTLIKALISSTDITKKGDWNIPNQNDIGYIDQFYSNLNNEETVFETIRSLTKTWSDLDIRTHLNNYLFKCNAEVEKKIANLSEGEKARLSFAIIGCQTPKILILDEITNNLDLETKKHVIDVLNAYPGTLIIICHEKQIVKQLEINSIVNIDSGRLTVTNHVPD